jgi:dinuclear metal center YbgI/SA1388 family protein
LKTSQRPATIRSERKKTPMSTKEQIADFCAEFLHLEDVPDPYCQNGLQVPGKSKIKKIALGTTASKNFLQMASDWQADAVIVHHGLFWGKGVRFLSPELTARLKILLESDISLFSYHLPLDAHPQVGNNAQIAKRLGLDNIQMLDICAIGEFSKKISFVEFQTRCADIFGQDINFAEAFSSDDVSRVGICSGGGSDCAEQCKKAGADTFLVGELSEHRYHDFAEMPINFVACGHYATERFGIQAFGEVLQSSLPDIQISFFSEPCPV